ncbi:MAG: DUF1902 domain-containing protein [Rhizomicrobium sp.]
MRRAPDKEFLVKAIWDAEAGVWVAPSDDVPGLATESKSFESLLKKLRGLVPELLELNGLIQRVIPGRAKRGEADPGHQSSLLSPLIFEIE